MVVVGYPRIFMGEDCNAGTWFSPEEQARLNQTADLLNGRTSAATARGFSFANPTSRFIGHAVCDNPEWINGLSNPISESYHPNRPGQASGYTPTVSPLLTGAAVTVSAATLRRPARRAALAAQQRGYADVDASIRPAVVPGARPRHARGPPPEARHRLRQVARPPRQVRGTGRRGRVIEGPMRGPRRRRARRRPAGGRPAPGLRRPRGHRGPDPDDAAAALATALAPAISGRDVHRREAPRRAAYAEGGRGDGRGRACGRGRRRRGCPTRAPRPRSAWTLASRCEQEWAYTRRGGAAAGRRGVAGGVEADGRRAVAEPENEVLDSAPVAPDAGRHPRCRRAGPGGRATGGPLRHRPDPGRRRAGGESARRLAQLLDIDAASYVKQVRQRGTRRSSRGSSTAATTSRRRSRGVRRHHGSPRGLSDDAAAGADPRVRRSDPRAPSARSTAEMIEEDPERYQLGDQAGLSGLQARYDDQLRGTPGVVVDAVAPDDKRARAVRGGAGRGQPLRLTLDVDLQPAAERLLADVGPASALVAMRPSNGEILAAANGPGTDGYNMATFGQFAPGSTFKSVSSLALLRAGLTPDSSTVPCTTKIVVDGKQFENYDDYPAGGLGRIPLRTAVANSCNTAFISQAGKLGRDSLADAAASLGMGVDHDLGFPAYFGSVEPPASETEAAADMIGQGKVLASPMVMATVIASIQSGRPWSRDW